MSKMKKPLLTDEFLDELAKEINEMYGAPDDYDDNERNNEKED